MATRRIHDKRASKRVDGREQRGDRTARALLDAARQAFAERGYAGASVRDIASDAQANPALVRYHFGSKEGLYYRVIDEVMGGLRERLIEAAQGARTIEERLARLVGAYVEHLRTNRDFPKIAMRASLDQDPGALRIARQHLRPLFDAISSIAGQLPVSPIGALDDAVLSVFGAALLPFLYAPILNELFGQDLLDEARVRQRREHLEALVRQMARTFLPSGAG